METTAANGMKNPMTVARAMVQCLEKEVVRVVFGYPGAAICPFYDSLFQSDIRHILVRHEQNAGHAANGYARMTGRPGVCIATSGPGATNLITAIATAYMDSIPLVIITGQVSCDQIGRDAFQEADITGAAEPFVKHSYLVKDAAAVPTILKQAFYIAGTGRPGPVLIDIPVDIQKAVIDFEYPETVDIRSYKPSGKGHSLQIKKVVDAIEQSLKPVICSGGGVFAAKAMDGIHTLCERCQIPVVTTMMGLGILPTKHPLNFGMLGMHGSKAANAAILESDLLILIGARAGDRAVTMPSVLGKRTKVVHIDIDPAEIGKNLDVSIPLVGDAGLILEQLLEKLEPAEHAEWVAHLGTFRKPPQYKQTEGFMNPKQFLAMLSAAMPDDTVVVADVGQNQMWTAYNFEIKQGRFLTSGGMGTMGYSVPAAIGAKLAAPDRPVVAVCGDGSFQMQMMELATCCQHKVPVKIVVMRNNRLGMVRELQTNLYQNKLTAVFLDGSPDFVMLAAAYGIEARRVENIADAEGAIAALIAANAPYLIEVVVNPDETSL